MIAHNICENEDCSTNHSQSFSTLYDCNNLSLKITHTLYNYTFFIFIFIIALLLLAVNSSSHLNDKRNKDLDISEARITKSN